ncbi:MAG: LysR family transcriptional regulator [Methylovirgula sp.]|uniref:LysR family transcriptional regulator n=1 Tax=Methylovirgula sp. TaxID=1978224 RepID=UPI0030764BB4
MDYLAAVRAFVRAVDLGSFSKAAVEQELKVSTVSRYVSGLEADLGVALFNRSTRRLHLTEGGADFYRRAVAILAEVEEARLAMHTLNASPRGVLRVNIPSAFGRRHVVPHLKDFHDLHPQVRLDISLTDTVVNLIETGTDVAIRIGALEDSTLVAKKLAPQRRIPVASPDYLGRQGAPSQPNDLTRHACLILAPQQGEIWYFRPPAGTEFANITVSGDVRANESEALLQLARDGLGIALLPTWIMADELAAGQLVPILDDWHWAIASGPERAIWGVYPPKRIVAPKVRAFLAFFAARFGRPPYWERMDRDVVQEITPTETVE